MCTWKRISCKVGQKQPMVAVWVGEVVDALQSEEGQHRRTHCDSLQGLSPHSPWMTCFPMYLAGGEVFEVGGGGAGVHSKRAAMWLKSQESNGAQRFTAITFFSAVKLRWLDSAPFSCGSAGCESQTIGLSHSLSTQLEAEGLSRSPSSTHIIWTKSWHSRRLSGGVGFQHVEQWHSPGLYSHNVEHTVYMTHFMGCYKIGFWQFPDILAQKYDRCVSIN